MNMKMTIEELNNKLDTLKWTCDYDKNLALRKAVYTEFYQGYEVGDGVTIHFYTDAEAYTIIKRTPKTITIQRDIATLNPDFKPKFIDGGFLAHCINQDEQTYTYERDTNGTTMTIHWSNKRGAFIYNNKVVTAGRNEFYDYNY